MNISTTFDNIEAADVIFDKFKAEDIVVVKWSPHSMTNWDISPGSKLELLEELEKGGHNMAFNSIYFNQVINVF